jgi:hypothetical protein
MSDLNNRVYVLVEVQPGKEQEFADEMLTKGLIADTKVERMDLVHGSFDFAIMLYGKMENIDRRIMTLRKSPFVRRTETLISFEMFPWEDVSGRLNE